MFFLRFVLNLGVVKNLIPNEIFMLKKNILSLIAKMLVLVVILSGILGSFEMKVAEAGTVFPELVASPSLVFRGKLLL